MTDKERLLLIAKEDLYHELQILYNVTNDFQARDLIYKVEDIRADLSHLPEYLPSYAYWSIHARLTVDIEEIYQLIEDIKKRHNEKVNKEQAEKFNKKLMDAALTIKNACTGKYSCDGCPFVSKNKDCILVMDGNIVPESWGV